MSALSSSSRPPMSSARPSSSTTHAAGASTTTPPCPPKRGELEWRSSLYSLRRCRPPSRPPSSPRPDTLAALPPFSLLAPPYRRPLLSFAFRVLLFVGTVAGGAVAGAVLSRRRESSGATPWVMALFALVLMLELWYLRRAGRRLYIPLRRRQLEEDPSRAERAGRARRWTERYFWLVKEEEVTPAAPPFPPAPAYPVGEMSMVDAARLNGENSVVQFPTPTYDSPEMHTCLVLEEGPPPHPHASSTLASSASPTVDHSAYPVVVSQPSSTYLNHLRRRSSLALSTTSHLPLPDLTPPPSPSFNQSSDDLLALPLPALSRQTSRTSVVSGASVASGSSRWELLRSARARDEHWDARRSR